MSDGSELCYAFMGTYIVSWERVTESTKLTNTDSPMNNDDSTV